MKSYTITPNTVIENNGPISKSFIKRGVRRFHDACEYVLHLPYGRTSDTSNYKRVLTEGRGTCSTKHALISALAEELNVNVDLMLGIYAMNESNTPGVGKVLKNSKYEFLPEAHCYLKYKGAMIDLTGLSNEASDPIHEFFVEERITPDQIGKYKQDFHQAYLKQWAEPSMFDDIWLLREACIEALSR